MPIIAHPLNIGHYILSALSESHQESRLRRGFMKGCIRRGQALAARAALRSMVCSIYKEFTLHRFSLESEVFSEWTDCTSWKMSNLDVQVIANKQFHHIVSGICQSLGSLRTSTRISARPQEPAGKF